MSIGKSLFFATLLISVFVASAKDSLIKHATINIVYENGREKNERVALKEYSPKVWRFSMPKEQLLGVKYVDVINDAAFAKKGEDGYFVAKDCLLGYFNRIHSHLILRRNPMKMFGMKTPRASFIAIIKGLCEEYETRIEAEKGVYKAFPRFLIQDIEFPAYEDLIVDFHELEGEDANYSGMGRAYRKYQLERGEVRPIKERIKDSPSLKYRAGAILVRFYHGSKPIPENEKGKRISRDYTEETELPMRKGWTFESQKKAIQRLHDMGIKELAIHDVGWNIRGHDGRYPQLFPVEPSVGGEEKLREVIKLAQSFGYQINCHTNQTDSYKIANCWNEDFVAKRKDGSLERGGVWSGGQSYTPCARAVYETFVTKDYPKIRELGYNGMHHVDVISAIPPKTCHDPKHPLNRKEWVQWQLKATKLAHELFGGFSSECGYDHVARDLDFALYINRYRGNSPAFDIPKNKKSARKMLPLVDEYVPLWQIAYHGIILSNAFSNDFNYSIFDENEKVYKTRRLQTVEYGSIPVFYGGTTHKNIHKVKKAYDDFQPLKHLQFEFMEEHKKIAPKVFLTRYSDGSRTICNYSEKEFIFEDKVVPPLDYILLK